MNDKLSPVASVFDSLPPIAAYELAVANALRPSFESNIRVATSTFCFPSFQHEWAVFLTGSRREHYKIRRSEPTDVMWCHDSPETIVVNTFERSIDTEIGAAIESVFQQTLSQVRYAEGIQLGADGVSFHFAAYHPKFGSVAGTTWSPSPESTAGKMVALSIAMCNYVFASPERTNQTLAKISDLVQWFDSPNY